MKNTYFPHVRDLKHWLANLGVWSKWNRSKSPSGWYLFLTVLALTSFPSVFAGGTRQKGCWDFPLNESLLRDELEFQIDVHSHLTDLIRANWKIELKAEERREFWAFVCFSVFPQWVLLPFSDAATLFPGITPVAVLVLLIGPWPEELSSALACYCVRFEPVVPWSPCSCSPPGPTRYRPLTVSTGAPAPTGQLWGRKQGLSFSEAPWTHS